MIYFDIFRAFGYRELGIDKMLLNLDHNGYLIWEPGLITQTICEVNIAKYPFDSQHCSIRLMSWMHTNRSLQVSVASDSIDTTNYYPNGEWDLVGTLVKAFSPEDGSYNVGEILPGAEAIIELRRRPVYYIISTMLPISMLSLLNVLVFMLPTNTGEKMTLAVTVLLSFTVFMSVVNEVMPKTSNSVSILGNHACSSTFDKLVCLQHNAYYDNYQLGIKISCFLFHCSCVPDHLVVYEWTIRSINSLSPALSPPR